MSYVSGDYAREDDLDEAKEHLQRLKAVGVKTCSDILQGMQDLHEDGPQFTAERVAFPAGNARKAMRLECLRPAGDWQSKTSKRQGRAIAKAHLPAF